MKRIFILLGIIVISMTLVGCTQTGEILTPPSYLGIKIENTDPVDGAELVPFYKAKYETVLVEISIDNVDGLEIKSIVINGYTYNSTRFNSNSDLDTIFFDLNVGNAAGGTTYSVDRINYIDGENSKSVSSFDNNEFKIYVINEIPTVTRENYNLTRESISIDFNIEDIDAVITAGTLKALLYSGETLVLEKETVVGLTNVEFTDLLADKHYEVQIIASFDRNDSLGVLTDVVLYSGTYSTLSNGIPSALVSGVIVSSNEVAFNIDFTDLDDVVVQGGLSVEIYNGDTLVDSTNISGDIEGLVFTDLLNDNNYTIKVVGNYNLRDGGGILEDNVLTVHSFSTLPRAIPLPVLLNLDLQENSIEFDVSIINTNNIIEIDSIVANLYIEGIFIDSANIHNSHVDLQVNNLFSNKEFTIELVANYDLNDGLGVQEGKIIFSESFSTLENAVPVVNVLNTAVTQGYVTLDLEIIDENLTLISTLTAVLYEEDVAVQSISFDEFTTQIVFSYPTIFEKNYYIEISADYNLRDGNGAVRDEALRRIVSYTAEAKAPIAEIKNVLTTTSSIGFDISVIDADLTILDNSVFVYLYLGEDLVYTLGIDSGDTMIDFDSLFSNNEYTIIVKADFNLDDGSGVLSEQVLITHIVNTEVKAIPTSEISNTNTTDSEISFDVDIIDNDSVISAGSILAILYHEDIEVDRVVLTPGGNFNIDFTGLLSSNSYELIFYLDYDLNDEVGVISDYVVGTITLSTTAKIGPSAEFRYSAATETTITVDIFVADTFNVVIPGTLQAVLMLNDVPAVGVLPVDLTVGMNSNVVFNGLYSNERYYVDVIASYDLNNGNPIIAGEVLISDYTITVSLGTPNAYITNIETTINSISFDVDVQDISATITGNLKAVLYLDEVVVTSVAINSGINNGVTFSSIDSETEYVVKIEADYDMNEFTGEVLGGVLDFAEAITLQLSPPTTNVSDIIPGYDSFTLDINLNNADGTITGNRKAILYKNGISTGVEVVIVDGINEDISFTGLLSDSTYEVKVFVDYDLNDENGEQLAQEISSEEIITLAKTVPEIIITNLVMTYSEITFDYALNDIHDVLSPGTLKAGLYYNGVLQAEKLLFTNSVSFNLTGLLADYDFEILITSDFDLDNGNGIVSDGDIIELPFTTMEYLVPVAQITGATVNQNSVDLDVLIIDDDSTSTNNLVAVLYDKDDVVLETIALVNGANSVSFSEVLLYREAYSIVIYSDYDLRDGEGEITDVVLAEELIIEFNKFKPQAAITSVILTETSITFDVDVYDNYSVITAATTKAILYLDGVYVDDIDLVVGANNALVFNTLYSNRDYVIRIETSYNNDDGRGLVSDYLMTSSLETTVAKSTPTASIIVDTVSASELIVDIVVDDDSSITTLVEAKLYDDENTLIDTKALIVGDNINVTFNVYGSSTYTIEVEATYDMNDGDGVITSTLTNISSTTPSSTVPTGEIISLVPTSSTIEVTYSFLDDDSVSTEQFAVLYQNDVFVSEIAIVAGESQVVTFTALAPNKTYVVKIESSYDLNDLDGLQSDVVLFENPTSTTGLIVIDPAVEIVGGRRSQLEVEVVDEENILTGAYITATLIQDGVEVDSYIITYGAVNTLDLINLLSDYDYTLEFEATYDSGNGNVTEVIYAHSFTTEPLIRPIVDIDPSESWSNVGGNLTVAITFGLDEDSIAIDDTWNALLYQDGVLVDTVDLGTVEDDAVSFVVAAIFVGFDHTDGSIYTVIIQAEVEINEVVGVGFVVTSVASRTFVDAGN